MFILPKYTKMGKQHETIFAQLLQFPKEKRNSFDIILFDNLEMNIS